MNKDIDNAKLAIVVNPLATPFKTSIEFIVFPIIGIINTTNAIYRNGIDTEPNNGKVKFESYAPSKSIGAAQKGVGPISDAFSDLTGTAINLIYEVLQSFENGSSEMAEEDN